MAIGNTVTVASLNAQAAQLAMVWRNNSAATLTLQAYTTAQGSSGLVTLGFTSGDATSLIALVNNMGTLAGVYNGTVQQGGTGGTGASLFNFGNALTALTGPF
jgi:hypothetical protein